MSTAPLRLQDLRRRRDAQAQAAPPWRFWGVCVHVCQREPLWEASRLATDNHGAPGSAGGPFEAIAAAGGGDLPGTETRRTGPRPVSTQAGPAPGDPARPRPRRARPGEPGAARPGGARGAHAHCGAPRRSRLPSGVVGLPPHAERPGCRCTCGGSDRALSDPCPRRCPPSLLRHQPTSLPVGARSPAGPCCRRAARLAADPEAHGQPGRGPRRCARAAVKHPLPHGGSAQARTGHTGDAPWHVHVPRVRPLGR